MLGQEGFDFDYDVVVFCNTTRVGYEIYLKRALDKLGSETKVVVTQSDGTPGTGKQSVFNYFMAHEEYDAVVFIDGDDFLYPCAFSVIAQAYDDTQCDIIGLQVHDMVYRQYPDLLRMQIDDDHWVIGWFGEQHNHTKERGFIDRNLPVGDQRTPDRLVWFTRHAFKQFSRPWFPSDIPVYEDYVASLSCLASHVYGDVIYVQMSTSNIYVHDATDRDSTCHRFLRSGKNFHDVDQVFRELIYPLNQLLGTRGFESCKYYENPNEAEFDNLQRISFLQNNMIPIDK